MTATTDVADEDDTPSVNLVRLRDEAAQFVELRERLRRRREELLFEVKKIGEILGEAVSEEEVVDVETVRRKKQAPQGIRTGLTGDLETYIADHPGCSLNEIHEAIGAEKAKITNMLVRLKREGRVKTSGARRSYTYSLVISR